MIGQFIAVGKIGERVVANRWVERTLQNKHTNIDRISSAFSLANEPGKNITCSLMTLLIPETLVVVVYPSAVLIFTLRRAFHASTGTCRSLLNIVGVSFSQLGTSV